MTHHVHIFLPRLNLSIYHKYLPLKKVNKIVVLVQNKAAALIAAAHAFQPSPFAPQKKPYNSIHPSPSLSLYTEILHSSSYEYAYNRARFSELIVHTLVSLSISLSTKTPKSKVKATKRYQSCIQPAAADSLFLLLLFCLALNFSVWCLVFCVFFFAFDALSPCLNLCICVHLTDWVGMGDFCSFVTGLMKDIFTFWASLFCLCACINGESVWN